ncbi:MAG: hypothetical protein HA490_01970 [Archaeoglobales archaeon]|nr:hypothetical protein [Archaeoglobales archaeon]
MKIGEVMTKNVVVVDYATKVREICRIIQKKESGSGGRVSSQLRSL